MPEKDPRYADVIAQAEVLCARQRAAFEAAQVEKLAAEQAWADKQLARVAFLKKYDAAPMDVSAYDAWLTEFVAAGGELTHFVEGNFPRIRMIDADLSALFGGSGINTPGSGVSMEEDYFSEPVIWTIDTPLDLADLPVLLGEQALTLHLTRNAVKNLGRAELMVLVTAGTLGETEFYVDGEFTAAGDTWLPNAYTAQAVPYVWNENVRNMMGKKVLL